MTLTNTGRLGIGITAPTDELHVEGGATISGALGVGGNINLTGTLLGDVQGTVIGNVVGVLAGNTNTTVGISTLNNLSVAGVATINTIKASNFSIGDNITGSLVNVFVSATNNIFVNDTGQIGIRTDKALPGIVVNGSSANAVFAAIGCGVTQFNNGAVDFSNAGLSTNRFMVPPKVNGTGGLQNAILGALVFDTSSNKLKFYNGTAWVNV